MSPPRVAIDSGTRRLRPGASRPAEGHGIDLLGPERRGEVVVEGGGQVSRPT